MLTRLICATILAFGATVFAADNALFGNTSNYTADECIIGVLETDGNYKTLLSALECSGLTDMLHGNKNVTLFAPNDDAFQNMPGFDDIQRNPAAMAALIRNHIVSDRRLTSQEFANHSTVSTMGNETLRFANTDGKWMVNDSIVQQTDKNANNGIVHEIDAVLSIPSTDQTQAVSDESELFKD